MAHVNQSSSALERQSLSDEAIYRLVDPRTGRPLRPLGVISGKLIWPMMGASPDDPSSEEHKEKEGTDDEGKDPEGEGSASTDSKDDPSKTGDAQAKIADLAEEKERHYKRRQEAERERDELKNRLEELSNKDKSEVDQAKAKVEQLQSSVDSLTESLRTAHLENAFLKDNTYSWHNPGRALRLADMSKVEIDDDGTVHGLKDALDKLAKSDSYLIKQAEDEKKKEKEQKEAPNTSGTSGTKTPKEKSKDGVADRQAGLINKYPALRR